MEGKICSKCGEFKSYSDFNKDKRNKDGYTGRCKHCIKKYNKQYYDSNKEEIKQNSKQYYHSNKEEIKTYQKKYNKQYYDSHKEELKVYKKQYYESHKEESKQYYHSHKEEINAYQKQYRDSHKEERKQYRKQYYDSNKEEIKVQHKQYRDSHKEERKQYYHSHKEEIKLQHNQYYHSHKEEIKTYQKKYYQDIKDKNIMVINDIIKNIEKYNLINKYNIPIYGCIYKIENIKTGRIYIGQTITPLTYRYNSNIIDGWKNERLNKNNQKFKDEIVNTDDFKVSEILDVGICKYHLDKLEAYYINLYDSYNNGYNNQNGNHLTDDGIEEFKEILEKYNINESELIWGN